MANVNVIETLVMLLLVKTVSFLDVLEKMETAMVKDSVTLNYKNASVTLDG